MIQVKEFNDMQESKDYDEMNKWLADNEDKIEVIDIKYGVSCYPPDEKAGWNTQYVSGALVIYKIEKELEYTTFNVTIEE